MLIHIIKTSSDVPFVSHCVLVSACIHIVIYRFHNYCFNVRGKHMGIV